MSLSSCTVCVPGLEAFEVEAAVLVGHAVAAIFEIDAHAGDAVVLAAVGVAGAFEHAADDEALLREQFFVHAHQRARLVRTHVARRERLRGVDRILHAAHRHGELDHVAQLDGLRPPRASACVYVKLVPSAAITGSAMRTPFRRSEPGRITRAGRQPVDHLHVGERAGLARVLQA